MTETGQRMRVIILLLSGGFDGDVGEMLARLDPAILARVPRELLLGLDLAHFLVIWILPLGRERLKWCPRIIFIYGVSSCF